MHEIILMLLLYADRLNQRTERGNRNQKVIVWFMWWLWWWSCDLWWSCCSCEVAEWFELDESKNTNVYVSGLPTDITLDEFKELMQQKGGIIAADNEGRTVLVIIWTFVCVYVKLIKCILFSLCFYSAWGFKVVQSLSFILMRMDMWRGMGCAVIWR